MSALQEVASAGLLAWTGTVIGASSVALARAWKRKQTVRNGAQSGLHHADDVVLIRPCRGFEPNLAHNLRSSAALKNADGLRVVFAVSEPEDAALGVAEAVAEELRARGMLAEAVVTRAGGPNNKAAQLAAVVAQLSPERSIIVAADSDVDLQGLEFQRMLTPLREEANVGATWVPPVEVPISPTTGDRLSAAVLTASLHAFPVLSGLDPSGMVGKLFAVKRASLERMGGFEALREVLGEDVELARRLRLQGETVRAMPFVVRSRASGREPAEVVERFGRWLTVVRSQRPALLTSYPLLFCATLPIVVACLLLGPSIANAVATSLALSSRLALGRLSAKLCGVEAPPLHLMLAGDVVLLLALFSALRSRTVVWRGQRLGIGRNGHLLSLPDPRAAR